MRRLAAWLPALAWALVIFNLSAQPRLPGPGVPGFDKVAHFGAYALLGWLLVRAADRSLLPLAVGAVLGVLYGATDEIHQMYVPGRSPDVMDWFADAAGVAAATFVYTRLRARRTARPGGAAAEAPSLSA
ncbi:MAG TPA: VanZ family protein [Longimicrobium sp.]